MKFLISILFLLFPLVANAQMCSYERNDSARDINQDAQYGMGWVDSKGRVQVQINAQLTPIPVSPSGSKGATATLTNVSGSASSVTLKASNSSRVRVSIVNDSAAILYIKEGTTASTSSYTYKLYQDGQVIIDDYTGLVTGIWDSATGAARVTEITP